jgi:hypothetical protein
MAALAIFRVDRVPYGTLIVIVEDIPVALSDGMPGRYAGHGNLRTEVMMVRSSRARYHLRGTNQPNVGQDTHNCHNRM